MPDVASPQDEQGGGGGEGGDSVLAGASFCENLGADVNLTRICNPNLKNQGEGCCGQVRSEQDDCLVTYKMFEENIESLCEDCCDPPIVAPPLRHQHPTYPTIDCTMVSNVSQICAPESCCSQLQPQRGDNKDESIFSPDLFCDGIFQSRGDIGVRSICWYCCSEPVDVDADEDSARTSQEPTPQAARGLCQVELTAVTWVIYLFYI